MTVSHGRRRRRRRLQRPEASRPPPWWRPPLTGALYDSNQVIAVIGALKKHRQVMRGSPGMRNQPDGGGGRDTLCSRRGKFCRGLHRTRLKNESDAPRQSPALAPLPSGCFGSQGCLNKRMPDVGIHGALRQHPRACRLLRSGARSSTLERSWDHKLCGFRTRPGMPCG